MNDELLQTYKKRLSYLQLRQAKQGINTPVEVLIEIDEIQEKIKDVEDPEIELPHSDSRINTTLVYRSLNEKYLQYIIRQDVDDVNERWGHRYVGLSGVTRQILQTRYQIIDRKMGIKQEQIVEIDSLEKGLEIHDKFVLIGPSGSGKTTTLKRLRLILAKRALEDNHARIPLLVNLAGWTDTNQDITSYIIGQRDFQGLPPVHHGEMILLLDGLNEMPMAHYTERVRSIEKWLRFNSEIAVIIACREQVYFEQIQLSIPIIKIRPLDDERIRRFLSLNLGSDKGDKLWRHLTLQSQECQSPRDLIHLARNPYFLDMISYIFEIKDGQLPNCRGQMFQIFVETLFEREQLRGTTNEVTLEELILHFGRLAFAMQSKRSSTKMPASWAAKRMSFIGDAQVLWDVGMHASILSISRARTETFVGFAHQLEFIPICHQLQPVSRAAR